MLPLKKRSCHMEKVMIDCSDYRAISDHTKE